MTENKKLLMDLTEIEQLHVKQYVYKFVPTDITEDIRKCRKACKIVKGHQGGKTGPDYRKRQARALEAMQLIYLRCAVSKRYAQAFISARKATSIKSVGDVPRYLSLKMWAQGEAKQASKHG